MTRKPRFGNFVTRQEPHEEEASTEPVQAPALSPAGSAAPLVDIPPAPVREERRPFSTRVRPSQKTALDAFVMDLKRAGWPVSQEGVLEEMLRLLQEDPDVRAKITAGLTRR